MTAKIITPFIKKSVSKSSIANRKPIHSVGINDADYEVCPRINGQKLTCHYYSTWVDMLTRCYSEKYQLKKPTYIDCRTVKEWLLFSAFKKWMKKQNWQGKVLDKDIFIVGNKIYSPEACTFVSVLINSLLTHEKSTKGKYPIGVSFDDTSRNKFIARCNIDEKRKYLGRFYTPEEAGEAYKIAKSKEINRVALLQSDTRVKNGLIRHAEHLLNG